MLKHKTYRQRVFIYFFSAFLLFFFAVLVFQYSREKQYKEGRLDNTLNNTAEFTSRYIHHNNLDNKENLSNSENFRQLDSILYMFSEPQIRITVINKSGKVLYDSFVKDNFKMDNHLLRPEVQGSLSKGYGHYIRNSKTTGQNFYYYAKNYNDYFVRCAVIYNPEIRDFLKAQRVFLFFMIFIFLFMWLLLYLVTGRLGKYITKLRDFAIHAGKNENIDTSLDLFDSEFDDIHRQIVKIYNQLRDAKDKLSVDEERLYSHLYALNEGVGFFTSEKEKILTNSHFIQYINFISESSTISAVAIFKMDVFKELIKKIDNYLVPEVQINSQNFPQEQITIFRNERYFRIQGIVFEDKSFEILITDVTKPEKRRLLKQQLTSNISHEMKTPLSSIRGYLETILNNKDFPEDKQKYFIKRAYEQSERMTNMLHDVALLNNIEDSEESFSIRTVKLRSLVNTVIENLSSMLDNKRIKVNLEINENVVVSGNDNLLSSVFQNLIGNTINYAGEDLTISIVQYLEDEKFYYFSYSDNGKGIPEEHLGRIFERFYRIDEGRSRITGGTGLGLSIVKNAILLHKGEISVRNKKGGGLEFLFSLSKRM